MKIFSSLILELQLSPYDVITHSTSFELLHQRRKFFDIIVDYQRIKLLSAHYNSRGSRKCENINLLAKN